MRQGPDQTRASASAKRSPSLLPGTGNHRRADMQMLSPAWPAGNHAAAGLSCAGQIHFLLFSRSWQRHSPQGQLGSYQRFAGKPYLPTSRLVCLHVSASPHASWQLGRPAALCRQVVPESG